MTSLMMTSLLYTILHNFEERFGNEPDKIRGGCPQNMI